MKYSSTPDTITRDYFDSLLLETRYIDSVLPCTKMTLWGETFDTPVMTAALSHLHNTAQDGMAVYAEGAAKAGAVHWVGMGEDEELERVVATGARSIKIIKPHADNREVFRKIEHAVSQGCFAVGMDTDHAFNSNGGYDDVFGLPMKPKSTAELKEFVHAAGVPFIVKGVLSPKDAEKCAEAGCAGLVVSHHHGMVQYSVPPLMVMQDIISAVGPEVQVFIDCGIASGMDVYKCLALGAKAVSVGRHLMPLLKNGPEAVAQRINEMTAELAGIMARTGVAVLEDMDPTVIHRRNF
jgi:isopentenyl diphosphate isomerase/L-lactate dehydrogenase-like FMN-dependent dehydrogenase